MTIKPVAMMMHHKAGQVAGPRSNTTGAVYLNCEFVVLEGKYARRKIWSLIGLHSAKGPDWANIGRAFIKGILNSYRGVSNKDNSPAAQNARRINGLGVDGVEFAARIDIEKDQNGDDKNVIKLAITPDKEYASLMGAVSGAASAPQSNSDQSASGAREATCRHGYNDKGAAC